jgi:hypothetical protein
VPSIRHGVLTTSLVVMIVLRSPISAQTCGVLLSPTLHDAGQKPPLRALTVDEQVKGQFERACRKTYSSGFPGGDEAFLHANSQSLRMDLDHVKALFKLPSSALDPRANSKDDPDHLRKLHISLGWDREQVLLWGDYFYIRRLFEENKIEEMQAEIDKIRNTFGLVIVPLDHWDILEQKTYYSKQALKNIIATFEYRAQIRLHSEDPDATAKLAVSYMHDRRALRPFFDVTGDPTAEILSDYCSGKNSK